MEKIVYEKAPQLGRISQGTFDLQINAHDIFFTSFPLVILGGGIAGITAAALLKEAGHTVAVIEADRIVKGVTVGTTAK